MAESPAHKFGQVIGELLESVVGPQLEAFCGSQGLYLDHQKRHRPARPGRKVTWQDQYGNIHDLDFVIERGGTDTAIGCPVAFIEVAWRRYTKHSRNKAQEIQGAILPLAEKHKWNNPFLGAVLAGVFTEGSLGQLRSMGFQVLYLPYETLVAAFAAESIDVRFDESTPDETFALTTERIESATPGVMNRMKEYLIQANKREIDAFFDALNRRLGRHVVRVVVIPLYGRINEFATIEDAIRFLDQHRIYEGSGDFRKFEVQVEFSNGDKVQAFFDSKQRVREFLDFVSKQ
ncbi:MAG: DNA methylase [Chloroflexi bacterium]|nr:DNA methylase [Chloroflexota bacterium]